MAQYAGLAHSAHVMFSATGCFIGARAGRRLLRWQCKRQASGLPAQLKLDNVKLVYAIDRETGLPTGQSVYVQKEANQLVEEFMLLANITVATRIYKAFPQAAMLRRQPLPLGMFSTGALAPHLVFTLFGRTYRKYVP